MINQQLHLARASDQHPNQRKTVVFNSSFESRILIIHHKVGGQGIGRDKHHRDPCTSECVINGIRPPTADTDVLVRPDFESLRLHIRLEVLPQLIAPIAVVSVVADEDAVSLDGLPSQHRLVSCGLVCEPVFVAAFE